MVGFRDGKVTFLWKDYAHSGKRRLMTLTAEEFLRRFLMHTLPRGFIRIRFFGFLANRRRAASIPLCKQLLESDPRSTSPPPTLPAPLPPLWVCPHCGGPMAVVERLTAYQIREELLRQKILVDTS
jgi:rubredoxin